MNVSDVEIVSKIRTHVHAEEGMRLLVNKYKERLYWVVRRMVNTHEDADDLVQEVFVKIYKNVSSFEENSKFFTWMYRIAVNETLTFLDKTKRRKERMKNVVSDHQVTVFRHTESEDILSMLDKAIDRLPVKQKMVFNLRYYDSMNYEEMSEMLDTSVGALKASYHHAAKKIEKYIKENTF